MLRPVYAVGKQPDAEYRIILASLLSLPLCSSVIVPYTPVIADPMLESALAGDPIKQDDFGQRAVLRLTGGSARFINPVWE